MSALQWALKFYKWRQIVSNNGKKIKFCKCNLFARCVCLLKQCFIPSPLQCYLHLTYIFSLPWGLHLGKIDFHACLHFPLSPPSFFSWLYCRLWPDPAEAGTGSSPSSAASFSCPLQLLQPWEDRIVVLQKCSLAADSLSDAVQALSWNLDV